MTTLGQLTSDWERTQHWPMVDFFRLRCQDFRCRVGDISMRNGHYLVLKVETPALTDGAHGDPIHLPGTHTVKSTRSMVCIRGLVLRSGTPYLKRGLRWTENPVTKRPRSEVCDLGIVEPQVQAGEGIIYQSYNAGKIRVNGLTQPLVIVREIDVECHFPREMMRHVDIGDFAKSKPAA
jgi:hypothetical protein